MDCRIVLFILLILLSVLLIMAGVKKRNDALIEAERLARFRDLIRSERTIVHAGGVIVSDDDGLPYTYTNSYDALLQAYDSGNRIVELDFMMSADGYMICAHEDERWANGIDSDIPLTDDEFLNRRVYDRFRTMDMDMLIGFMREHPDLYIVTDIKDGLNIQGCQYICDHYSDVRDRFIIQIYHPEEYAPVKGLGYNSIIYTLYNCDDEELIPDRLSADISNMDLVAVTFWEEWMQDEALFDCLKSTGVPMCVHTVNIRDSIEYDLNDGGMTAVYTDNIDNDWMR